MATLPPPTLEELRHVVVGSEQLAVRLYMERTRTPYPQAVEAIRRAMAEAYGQRQEDDR